MAASTRTHSVSWCIELHSLTDPAASLPLLFPLQMMATSVVLATLSILPYERALFGRTDDLSAEQEKERTIRMATILGFTVDKRADTKHILTRSALVTNINNMNLLAMVPAEVRHDDGTWLLLLGKGWKPSCVCYRA